MQANQYFLPIKVTIECENTDSVIHRIANTIHDAVKGVVSNPRFDCEVTFFDMEYSIHKKMKDEDFK